MKDRYKPVREAKTPFKAAEKVKIQVGNTELDGILINDHTYAPVRVLAEALGRTVT